MEFVRNLIQYLFYHIVYYDLYYSMKQLDDFVHMKKRFLVIGYVQDK